MIMNEISSFLGGLCTGIDHFCLEFLFCCVYLALLYTIMEH